MVKRDSPENAFALLQSPTAASFTPLQPTLGIVHGDLRLLCGCSAMDTHFIKVPTNSYFAKVASRGSLELSSECCSWRQTIFTRYTLQHSAVPFCELVWLTTGFSMAIARLCARCYSPVSNGCGWNSWIHSFVHVVHLRVLYGHQTQASLLSLEFLSKQLPAGLSPM